MKEKILAALKTKFSGVQDDILDRIAEKLAETVKKEDQIDNAVSGVTFDTLLQSETDRRVTEGNKTTIVNYEKKHSLKDGKPVETKKDPVKPDPKPDDDKDMPAWAKVLIESQEKFKETVSGLMKNQEKVTKQSQAAAFIKKSKIPEKVGKIEDYHQKILSRINFDDETISLEDQVKAFEAEYLELKQEAINKGVESGDFTEVGKGEAGEGDMKTFLDNKFPKEAESKLKT
jgi:hypothetical protein